METEPKRRRGAQPGNANALKHGFYAREFTKIELEDLDAVLSPSGLEDEIPMYRIMMKRIFKLFCQIGATENIDMQVSLMEIQSRALITLANALKTDKFLTGGESSDAMTILGKAIAETTKEVFSCG